KGWLMKPLDEGRFRLPSTALEECVISIDGGEERRQIRFYPRGMKEYDLGDIVLSSATKIAGRVTIEDKPTSDATIEVRGHLFVRNEIKSDVRGNFWIDEWSVEDCQHFSGRTEMR